MSLNSWKKEFYKTMASDPRIHTDPKIATMHSLRKWKGLRSENLRKHKLHYTYKSPWGIMILAIKDDDGLWFAISAGNCSLCAYSYNFCEDCPLYAVLDDRACDSWGGSPWKTWQETRDPEPMIKALEQTLESFERIPDNEK